MRARVHLVLSIYKPNYQTVSAQAQCLSSLSENKYCRKKQKMAGDEKYQPTSKAELKSWQVEILHVHCERQGRFYQAPALGTPQHPPP